MAWLDRLAPVKEVAQIGAAISREFAYQVLSVVAAMPEDVLSDALRRLVDAELMFQRGAPPDSVYSFKHALVQDAPMPRCCAVGVNRSTHPSSASWRGIGKTNGIFASLRCPPAPAAATRALRQRLPSTRRPLAAAACSKAWRG
jgi:hypothetical protein